MIRPFQLLVAILVAIAVTSFCSGASYETANFIVECPDPGLARGVAEAAESFRTSLWQEWFGTPPPDNWAYKAEITVKTAPGMGAGGATSMAFDQGEVFGFSGTWQGSPERLLDSVVPHEVMHTVLASHFRKPVPRWIDEGICTTLEHESEIDNWRRQMLASLSTGKAFPTNQLMEFTEYPADVATLYAQGWSLTEFLIQKGGRSELIRFLTRAFDSGSWPTAAREVYGYADLMTMQNEWVAWVASESRQVRVAGQCPPGYACGPGMSSCGPAMSCGPGMSCGQQIQWSPSPPRTTILGSRQQQPMTPRTFAGGQPAVAAVAVAAPAAAKPCECGDKLAGFEARIKELEARQAVPGPKGDPGPAGPAGPAGKDGADGKVDEDAIAKRIAAMVLQQQPAAPAGISHYVLVADESASYWPRLKDEYRRAAEVYSQIRLSGVPNVPVGALPQLVAYRDGKPLGAFRGAREVSDALVRIARNEPPKP